ncbi:MAG: alginate export family protein [Planctomycetes bacterium]|nr:alginate export family protein [Planctomycetota bacterium]
MVGTEFFRRVHRSARIVVLGGAGVSLVSMAAGQEPGQPSDALIQQQRAVDRQLDEQRKQLAPLNSLVDWQWGGWFDYYIFHFDDGIQSQRVLQRPSMALWTRARIDDGAHEIFARMRLSYSYFNPGDEYDRQQDWVGPNLDRGWYEVDVGKAFRLNNPSDPLQAKVRIGRQDFQLGTGYVLDQPLDAVVIRGKVYDFSITGLIGKSIASYPNIDRSDPVDSHSNRCFFGVQAAYEGFENHVPFAYALWNNDKTDERPNDPLQNYAYDTQYFGFGSRGTLVKNLNYWGEFAFEQGHSYGDGMFLRRDVVDAWGWDLGVEYLFESPTRPRLAAEYMFASGDADRVFSPTNAAGGNRGDDVDSSFVGFGYRDTGIAAGPALSNLHIWKFGGSLTPLETVQMFRDMEVGTNWLVYHKHHARGAISDPTAGDFEGFVGWEMDYFVNWRLASDLAWTIRWGMFFPGQTFDNRDERSFLFTGLTWSF